MSNLKELMTNGVFGKTSDGDNFVIVNDTLVYQDGEFDEVSVMAEKDDLPEHRVVKLVKGIKSFEQMEHGHGTVIYDESETEDKKDVKSLKKELKELLDDIKKDAKSSGLNDEEAEVVTDTIFALASMAALVDLFGDEKKS